MSFGLGLVIGKFLPPHLGHSLLIETAQAQSERVVVILCEREADPIPAALRARWLRELHPRATVMVVEDRYDPGDSAVWAENAVRWLGRAPDAVFTSEDYGQRWAALMGARHVLVDRARERVPVSGSAVRADPFAEWEHLGPPVRGFYAKRICLVGAESTGTTTLAAALAEALGTCWVEEFGREYTAAKWARGEHEWRTQEFEQIAREQVRRADTAARRANRLLVCDTNAFATVLWHRRYVGGPCPGVEAVARSERCDLYLLTGDEIPFVQDGLRDGEHVRHEMHCWFEQSPRYRPGGERLREAVRLARELFAGSRWRP